MKREWTTCIFLGAGDQWQKREIEDKLPVEMDEDDIAGKRLLTF